MKSNNTAASVKTKWLLPFSWSSWHVSHMVWKRRRWCLQFFTFSTFTAKELNKNSTNCHKYIVHRSCGKNPTLANF